MTNLKGMGQLTRVVLRRDRIRIPVWVSVITIVTFMFTAVVMDILDQYPVEEVIPLRAMNPALRFMDAPSSGYSDGAFFMLRMSVWIILLYLLMSIGTVLRHTRENEEEGVYDMVGSAGAGRYAGAVSVLLVITAVNIITGLLGAGVLIGLGLEVTGSLLAGFIFAVMGISFAFLAALTAQLAKDKSGANGLAWLVTLVLFTISGAANAMGSFDEAAGTVDSLFFTWFSPFGWYQQIHAFHDNNLWAFAMFALFVLALFSAVMIILTRRDIGAGIVEPREGRPRARSSLLSPFGLTRRLTRRALLTLSIVFFLLGAVVSTIGEEFTEALGEVWGDELFGDVTVIEYFLGELNTFFGVFAVIFVGTVLFRMRKAERDGTMEHLLATATKRRQFYLSHVGTAYLAGAIILFALGLGTGLFTLAHDDVGFVAMIRAPLHLLPAFIVIGAFIAFLFALTRRYGLSAGWFVIVFTIAAGPLFGPLLDLPPSVMDLSPFTHVPMISESFTFVSSGVMLLVAVILLIAGAALFARRDLDLPR